MALNKAQYESIMNQYEEIRDRNRLRMQDRQEEVYRQIPEFRELDDSVSTLSVSLAKQMLAGDENALNRLHASLQDIAARKALLLQRNNYPAEYLSPIYDCEDCKDTGFITGADGLKTKCHCFKSKEITLLYDQSHIRSVLSNENFSTLSYAYYQGEDLCRFEKAVEISKNFVQNFKQDYRNLFFYGTVGTGKSFLSGCIANELLNKGCSVIYFSASRLFETLAHYSFDNSQKEFLHDFYDDLYHSDLVIIDDLGTELTNAFVSSQLFSCLNERQLCRKSTIISTNLSLEELRDRYSDRVFSRITSNYELCKLSGADIRMLKKRNNRK